MSAPILVVIIKSNGLNSITTISWLWLQLVFRWFVISFSLFLARLKAMTMLTYSNKLVESKINNETGLYRLTLQHLWECSTYYWCQWVARGECGVRKFNATELPLKINNRIKKNKYENKTHWIMEKCKNLVNSYIIILHITIDAKINNYYNNVEMEICFCI